MLIMLIWNSTVLRLHGFCNVNKFSQFSQNTAYATQPMQGHGQPSCQKKSIIPTSIKLTARYSTNLYHYKI